MLPTEYNDDLVQDFEIETQPTRTYALRFDGYPCSGGKLDGLEAMKPVSYTHLVGDQTRVLTDINTFVSVTDEKSVDFSSNQVMRVLDQIANDIASLFNSKYLGKVQNDASGRVSLWSDIVAHHTQLQTCLLYTSRCV